MSRGGSPGRLTLGAGLLALAVAGTPGVTGAVGEDPVAEVTEALRALGPPGMVWGRLAVEEESPVGPWTPLSGIEVALYPATPALVAELERIRESARASAAQFESVVARVRAALAVHQGRIDRQTGPSPGESDLVAEPPLLQKPRTRSPTPRASSLLRPQGAQGRLPVGATPAGAPEAPAEAHHPWRQKTDSAGLFVFNAIPSGEWLVVAIRISPYGSEKFRADAKGRQGSGRSRAFLPRAAGPAREAELWLTRVRVVAAERVGLELTDRARWLAGPIR